MNQELIRQLSEITDEEQEILAGRVEIDTRRYCAPFSNTHPEPTKNLMVDSKKMLEDGKLIRIRLHTRFVHFPRHTHNYVELVYMCQGATTHFIDGTKVVLQAGELLFLNQHAVQEILPAGREDIAVNFIILREFFDTTFQMMGEEENMLRDFLVGCLRSDTAYERFLHFQVADVLPVQNLVENMVWTLLHNQPGKRSINQVTMGLLFLQLMHYTDKIHTNENSYEQELMFQVLRYIDGYYRDGELTQLADQMGYGLYWLSRMIKRLSGHTFKELLQFKRLNQASFLLLNTKLTANDISLAVGYDNTSYFYRIFKTRYGCSPREYRLKAKARK